jgi:surface antigen
MTAISGNLSYGRRGALYVSVLVAAFGVVGMSASSVASAASHHRVTLAVSASDEGLSVGVRALAGSHCTLRVSVGHRSSTFAPITLGRSGRGAIKWTVPSNAPSGTWTISTICVRRRAIVRVTARIVLVNHGDGNSGLVAAEGDGLGGKGGGSQSCAAIATPPGGEACFIGDPFATYQNGEDVGQCTWYAAGMRPDLDGITTGNASEWLKEASGKRPEGTTPVVGAIAVNTTAAGGLGHVAYVAGVENGGATLILDEANLKYDERVYLNVETPASEFQGYIYGGAAGNGPGSNGSPAPTPAPSPSPAPAPTPSPPTPSPPAPAPSPTYSETSGPGPVHTWTDYSDAGGTEGPSIPDNSPVQIACKITGFAVEDGNTWWYRIASSPWSGSYYASADAFYNEPGRTSGSLKGTPFVDSNVPDC